MVVLFGEIVLVVSYGVPGHITEDLDEPVVELDLADRLLRLVSASVLELLGILHFHGAVLVYVRVIVLYIDITVILHIEQRLVCVRILRLLLAVSLPDITLRLALEAIQLLLVPATEVVAALAVVLVVVVRRL